MKFMVMEIDSFFSFRAKPIFVSDQLPLTMGYAATFMNLRYGKYCWIINEMGQFCPNEGTRHNIVPIELMAVSDEVFEQFYKSRMPHDYAKKADL